VDHLHPSCEINLSEIASLTREQLVDRLLNFDGRCRLDFTDGFLSQKSTERLRHILIAAYRYAAKQAG